MPQPIDMQTELARVTALDRVQQVIDRVSLAALQRVAIEEQEQRVAAETQVQQTHAKSEEIEPEMRRKNPYRYRRKQKTDAGTEGIVTKDTPPHTGEEHQLDITV
jgi:hypothetical protein